MKNVLFALLFCLLFCVSAYSQEAEKIDEFGRIYCDEYLNHIDGAIFTAQSNPSATVYILIYEGKEWRYSERKKDYELANPAFGSAKAKIRSVKQYFELRKYSAENFKFIEAGFREEFGVEIWLVQKGATPPKSAPTLEKIKYRKGKAAGYCVGCCGE